MTNVAPPEKPSGAFAVLWIGGGMILWAIGLVISHVYGWLRYGAFGRYPTAELFADVGLPYPNVSWVGIQNIITWLMACQAAYILFFTGMFLFWLAGLYTDDYERRANDYRQRQRTEKIAVEREARREENLRLTEEARQSREAGHPATSPP